MRSLLAASWILLAAVQAAGATGSADGVLYFDRGHYWIELTLGGLEGSLDEQTVSDPSRFEIRAIDGGSPFKPYRVELLEHEPGKTVLVLSSGKLKGRRCYSVIFRLPEGDEVAVDSICDPFLSEPRSRFCAEREFFRKYIASAFSRSGSMYNLNRFDYGYDFSAERSTSHLAVQPCFEFRGWAFEPGFEYGSVTYLTGGSGSSNALRQTVAVKLSKSGWAGKLGLSVEAGYEHERSSPSDGGESVQYSHSVTFGGRVRLDNLFDHLNSYCTSVFKGVDLGLGYAWYESNDEEVWADSGFERTTPYLMTRFTWTFLYGFQLSYSLESYWPTSHGENFEEFHSIRLRLLLRDVLDKPGGKRYHPDLELSYDRGRKLPLLEDEKKVMIKFTFDLYPW